MADEIIRHNREGEGEHPKEERKKGKTVSQNVRLEQEEKNAENIRS